MIIDASASLDEWNLCAATELVLRLRRMGVHAYEGSVCADGTLLFSFEREALGQKLVVETVLLAWPGAVRVRHVTPGLVRLYRQDHEILPTDRRSNPFRKALLGILPGRHRREGIHRA